MSIPDLRLTPEKVDGLIARIGSIPAAPVGDHLTPDEMEAYEQGGLAKETRDRFDQHLGACDPCAVTLESHFRVAEAWEGPGGCKRLEALDERLRLLLRDYERREASPQVVPLTASHERASAVAGLGEASVISPRAAGGESPVEMLLNRAGAVQRGSDYILPSGLHCDTHIDVSVLCRSEKLLDEICEAFRPLLAGLRFDTIVAAGWTMATIARRLFPHGRNRRGNLIRFVTVEGYDSPLLLQACPRGSRAVILLDTVVTGALVSRIKGQLEARGVDVAQAVALVDADRVRTPLPVGLQSLCSMKMTLQAAQECSRHATMPIAEWNPIACRMTRKKDQPHSASEFLSQNASARELWALVDAAAAYEHHHRDGDRHYLGFLDTQKLLTHSTTQPVLIKKLSDLVLARLGAPDVLLVPRRARALLLAKLLAGEFKDRYAPVRVVSAIRRDGWFSLTSAGAAAVRGRRVLVADTAVGHGDTLDQLALLVKEHGATQTSATTILSRLPEGAEEALDARLNGGFARLYGVPLRPFTIPASVAGWGCPYCSHKAELRKAARNSGLPALRELERELKVSGFRRRSSNVQPPQQLTFPTIIRPLLERCRRGVASGVTLHALHTAMGDGMAPLSVRELLDDRVPLQNRVAMIEHLPVGVVRWSGEPLLRELRAVLTTSAKEPLWLAAMEVLTREGYVEWVDDLSNVLVRSGDRPFSQRFWRHLSYASFRLGRGSGETSVLFRRTLRELVESHGGMTAGSGLQSMLDAATDQRTTNAAG